MYSLADLDSIFVDPQESINQTFESQTLESSFELPKFDMEMPDDFLKDVILEPGLDHNLLDVDNIFGDSMVTESANNDILEADQLLVDSYLCKPEPEQKN